MAADSFLCTGKQNAESLTWMIRRVIATGALLWLFQIFLRSGLLTVDHSLDEDSVICGENVDFSVFYCWSLFLEQLQHFCTTLCSNVLTSRSNFLEVEASERQGSVL